MACGNNNPQYNRYCRIVATFNKMKIENMGKIKFHSVNAFHFNDFSEHYGYFQHEENAMKAALKAVENIQKKIDKMRELETKSGLNSGMYSEDIVRDLDPNINPDNFKIWRGSEYEVQIHSVEIED